MKDISFLTSSLIAHRGYFDIENPENSIGAFKKAIKMNYTIELDVHLTKDKKVVVFHDDNLKRMTGLDKKIKDCTFSELEQLRLKNTSYKIPLLEEVLKLVNNKVPIIIELKYDRKTGLLEKELVKIVDNYQGDFAVKSFRFSTMLWFLYNKKDYVRGQLLKDNTYLFMLFLTKPDFISYNIKTLPNKNITKIKKKKLLLGWTAKTKEEYNAFKDYCDNLICENIL